MYSIEVGPVKIRVGYQPGLKKGEIKEKGVSYSLTLNAISIIARLKSDKKVLIHVVEGKSCAMAEGGGFLNPPPFSCH